MSLVGELEWLTTDDHDHGLSLRLVSWRANKLLPILVKEAEEEMTYRENGGNSPITPSRKIPYWSIVIPMTALSAFLLLSKPRKSTPKETTEPISETTVNHA